MVKLIIIVSTSQNNIIGKSGRIPWSWPNDLIWFKEQITNKAVVMGYNTWKSINEIPLPNCNNFVLTHKQLKNVVYKCSVQELLPYLDKYPEVFIIGGMSIYEQFIDKVHEIRKCILPFSVAGDKYFPDISDKFKLEKENKLVDGRILKYWINTCV